jgi:hypothetical protein
VAWFAALPAEVLGGCILRPLQRALAYSVEVGGALARNRSEVLRSAQLLQLLQQGNLQGGEKLSFQVPAPLNTFSCDLPCPIVTALTGTPRRMHHLSIRDACTHRTLPRCRLLARRSSPRAFTMRSQEFYNNALSAHANLRDEYMMWRQVLPLRGASAANLLSLCQVPFLLNPEAKSRIFQVSGGNPSIGCGRDAHYQRMDTSEGEHFS